MLTREEAQSVLERAQAAGATGGDLRAWQSETFESTVRLGEIEKIREAKSRRISLRLFCGQRSAILSTSDFTPSSLNTLVTHTCSLARLSPEDPYAGLPDPDQIPIPDYDLCDPDISALSMDTKMDLAKRAENAAFSVDPRIKNSDGASLDHGRYTLLYASTHGFLGSYTQSSISLSTVPVASQNGTLQRDFWHSTRRRYKELQSAEEIGVLAGTRAVRRLGARSVQTQVAPVVFDPETAASLLSHLASALSGYAIYKKASFLVDKIGTKIASTAVTLYDDPTLPGALGTQPFDGEGVPSRKKMVIEKGILQSYLLDTYSGKKLGLPSTGNASWTPTPTVGVTNFQMTPGESTPEEILRTVPRGFYVTELIGFGVNPVTGDYSQGAAGLWIDNGALAYPVEEVTLAGNLQEMLLDIEQVGNDRDPWKKIAAPTLKIARMTIAGKP